MCIRDSKIPPRSAKELVACRARHNKSITTVACPIRKLQDYVLPDAVDKAIAPLFVGRLGLRVSLDFIRRPELREYSPAIGLPAGDRGGEAFVGQSDASVV